MQLLIANRHYFEKASMYGMLADFYKYTNPTLHIHYYQKQLKYLNKAIKERKPEKGERQSTARVRIMHATPDAGPVDIYVNGIRVLKEFPYKKVSEYIPLPQGRYQIDIYPAGNQTSTVISRRVEVENGKLYTLVATGADNQYKLVTFKDEPRTPPGEAKIRTIHVSQDAPAVDVAVKKADVVFADLKPRQSSDYLNVTPMHLDLQVRPVGTSTSVLDLAVSLYPNTAYSIFVIGTVGGEKPLEALLLTP
ncbi:MAG: DUF4397 domain-containing protein [Bacillus sp. (in: firmicutes)]